MGPEISKDLDMLFSFQGNSVFDSSTHMGLSLINTVCRRKSTDDNTDTILHGHTSAQREVVLVGLRKLTKPGIRNYESYSLLPLEVLQMQ